MTSNKIHIAFGFHVNCYHSYRGDTPDAQGFGSDLRIIRGIIQTLDTLNAAGIPVKATWDSENFFSLERILPEYAPDIIESMQRRVKENGDENIIMGYSNGALGAMQPDELQASIDLAVTNPQGSGLRDLFGTCERIVRPQEVMFTPSQVHTYRRLGVKALCLYYSCVPFDAFKTLIPLLDDEKAHNPLTFEYRGEGLTVLPTYSNADVCDAGCLRAWVKALRKKQVGGEINNDLFLFINMDADAIFWESLHLPLVGSRIANTDGIHGLVKEVADLDYIVFDTPGGYLKTHAPVGTIRFTQDTADGNFTGYASWAEKPYNRKIWTAIERSRTAARVHKDDASFLDRVKLLSTTHFGLATPVLNIQREKAADRLAKELTDAVTDTAGPLTIHDTTGSALQCVQLSCPKGVLPAIEADGLQTYSVIRMGDDSVLLLLRFDEVKDACQIRSSVAEAPQPAPTNTLQSGGTTVTFAPDGKIQGFTFDSRPLGGADFLQSYLTYGGKRYDFTFEKLEPVPMRGGAALASSGRITLPGAKAQGSFRFCFFTSDAADGVFVLTDVQYPYTAERDSISTENSTLGRYTDDNWQEAAPFCLSPDLGGGVSVVKRNFEGDISAFRAASYGEVDPKNKTLASFNNQLTAGMIGLTNGNRGLLLANARTVLGAMAHCPMRLEPNGAVRMNPFGTFYGPQRHHPNRSGDRIPKTFTLVAPQSKSLAPSYNGCRERAALCLCPFSGNLPDEATLADPLAFADGAYVTGSDALLAPFSGDNIAVHTGGGPVNEKIRSPLMTGIRGNLWKYVVYGFRAVSYIIRRQRKAKG